MRGSIASLARRVVAASPFMLAFLMASPATAQELPVSLPTPPDISSVLPTPDELPIDPATTDPITGIIGGGSDDPLPGGDGGTAPGGGGTKPKGSTPRGTTHGGSLSAPAGTAGGHNHTVNGATSVTGVPAARIQESYGASAGRALSDAAGRAAHLVGPLAPVIAIALFVLALIALISRGSERLVRAEPGTNRRIYRL